MQTLEYRVEKCEERIKSLEEHREKDIEGSNGTKEKLSLSVQRLDDLIEKVEKMPEQIETSVMKCIDMLKTDHENIYKRMDNMDKRIDTLSAELDNRTINAEAKKYSDIKKLILSTILTGILTFLLGMFLGK